MVYCTLCATWSTSEIKTAIETCTALFDKLSDDSNTAGNDSI